MRDKYKNNGGLKRPNINIVCALGINNKSFASLAGTCGAYENRVNDGGFFKSKKAEYLFYLTKLEGKQRNSLLGLTDEHYENKELAKKWYREVLHCINPDKVGDDQAFQELRKIYKTLIEN